jgi:hypothetical protein
MGKMGSPTKSTWAGFWKSSPSKPSQTQNQIFEDQDEQDATDSRDNLNRITSANQRRYAEYLAGSLNIDSSTIQPAG